MESDPVDLPGDRKAFSDALCTLISEELSIAGDRIYISMTDAERQNWGWNHSTFSHRNQAG
ncbi:MAG: phenylpyruvate tautomerase MIF-related protein [Methylophilaceae bacterium]